MGGEQGFTDEDRRGNYDRATSDADVAKTHPGFTITCDKCGSKRVIVLDSRGWSVESGRWGAIDLWCLSCGQEVAVADEATG